LEGRILKLPLGMRTSSRKGHGGLPREREIFWGWGKEKGRKGMCGKKKLILMCGKVLFMRDMCARIKHGRISMKKPLEFYFK
jgi:hypothetical protein